MGQEPGGLRGSFLPLLSAAAAVLVAAMTSPGASAAEGAPRAPGIEAGMAAAVQIPPGDTIDPPPQEAVDPDELVDPDTLLAPPGLEGLLPDFDAIEGVDRELIAEMVERAARQPSAFPRFPERAPAGSRTGVWEWDRSQLLVIRALNLEELLRQVPGVTTLRTGDYGNPAAATAFGLDGGRIRVFMDGFEVAPLESSVVDLAQIPLAGLDRVRVERQPGELRVELRTLESQEPDPYTFVQAGTGDLSTDFFRGAFAHPQVLGGQAAMGLERLATRGTGRTEPGTQLGLGFRYSVHRGDETAVALEFRRGSVDRYEGLLEGGLVPQELSRTDWTLRGRHELSEGLVAEAFAGGASLGGGGDDGGVAEGVDDLRRRQYGARIGLDRGRFWARAALRGHSGGGWPSYRGEVSGGILSSLGGADLHVDREGWEGADGALSVRGRIWSAPLYGFSLFAQAEDGRRGVPFLPVDPGDGGGEDGEGEGDEDGDGAESPAGAPAAAFQQAPEEGEGPAPRFTERTGLRVGSQLARGDVSLTGAYLVVEADSLHSLGLPPEGEGVVTSGGRTNAVEVVGQLPVPFVDGLSVQGSYTEWLRGPRFRYLPPRSWSARLGYHNVFLDSENLELWTDVGAQGRSPMEVPAAGPDGQGLEVVPSAMEWSFRLQVRVQSVRAFVHWENLTYRTENRDFPGRNLPGGRATWGIRWTMWN